MERQSCTLREPGQERQCRGKGRVHPWQGSSGSSASAQWHRRGGEGESPCKCSALSIYASWSLCPARLWFVLLWPCSQSVCLSPVTRDPEVGLVTATSRKGAGMRVNGRGSSFQPGVRERGACVECAQSRRSTQRHGRGHPSMSQLKRWCFTNMSCTPSFSGFFSFSCRKTKGQELGPASLCSEAGGVLPHAPGLSHSTLSPHSAAPGQNSEGHWSSRKGQHCFLPEPQHGSWLGRRDKRGQGADPQSIFSSRHPAGFCDHQVQHDPATDSSQLTAEAALLGRDSSLAWGWLTCQEMGGDLKLTTHLSL